MKYLVDADVFIQAKNMHYGFEFCPAFWQWLEDQHASGAVKSIEKIGDQLEAGDDELAIWAKDMGKDFFLCPCDQVIKAMPKLSTWTDSQHYSMASKAEFFEDADFYLVSHALAHKCVVVTHEIASMGKKVKIPNACGGVGVECITPWAMLQRSGAKFVLKSS